MPQQVEDFTYYFNYYGILQVNFKGSSLTWWNGRCDEDCVFVILDRVIVNQDMIGYFKLREVEHLPRTGLDYAPLFIIMVNQAQNIKKPLKFLDI